MGSHEGSDSKNQPVCLRQHCQQAVVGMVLAAVLLVALALCPFVGSLQSCDTADSAVVVCALLVAVISEAVILGALMLFGERLRELCLHTVSVPFRHQSNDLSPPGRRNASFSIPLRI